MDISKIVEYVNNKKREHEGITGLNFINNKYRKQCILCGLYKHNGWGFKTTNLLFKEVKSFICCICAKTTEEAVEIKKQYRLNNIKKH